MKLRVVILAAGKGTRMRSDLPKVLHKVANKPMVEHVIDTARSLKPDAINLIYGHGGDQLQQAIAGDDLTWVEQREQLGTGHAVQQVIPHLKSNEKVIILYGDVPLLTESTLIKLVTASANTSLGLLTMTLAEPTGYGRIVRNERRSVTGIVEQKDANAQQLAIDEVNTGIMIADSDKLKGWLEQLSNDNAQKEYYLTDIVEMAAQEGVNIATAQPDNAQEVEGANNRQQLASLERALQQRQAEELMTQGVTLIDPARFDCRGKLSAGSDVTIDINAVFEGNVVLGDRVVIEPNCVIRNSVIGDDTVIRANSHIEDAKVAKGCKVGPFARLRPGAELADEAQVGNFVEMKKSRLGKGSKASHLTYLGDTQVGEYANIGAGTITCNYDGVNKALTEIDDGAFIGSNSSLVAPVSIGKNATVGAGSVITRTVADDELAVARGKQRNISGWQRPQSKKGS
ncbi:MULTISPECIES: bifunctional UDP-N-acetylglucosamine diphosphorylase/glucosamine-1-phosphate N-acetyltransferase GlmU [Idiomarina]|jgi:bifunctional UDP-N-acetylglucosamine pyrophosphorylase/glucosamine-1-phosphate N-acetyltransferase|uniref:bifunctional UDP-N-acetylglucosamine diphosphorylase/glucosamine-1-phosphate N-acetyltransferase GlmU n=1 Tax=Idiomarina TaxID=135575 RepID=UPI000C3AFC2B|nr:MULTISPECIES: bifunctional UDP-N-acetylglucosamine diphosphorylase/glucosamine-1-phosphate N-acetyltransferase GlmU [Idiomarina]MAO68508.1 UDP-N-acetylglucosamine diphosphorylase/glucosamine-1-phosphate N-acetyltransferase [Idiomarina sp.]MBF80905.1 UDP-N-acetylglucosamine diphosphorylase/glucosamine-1-phosphate N-acetyltransferase [Idiomarina sp.]|tara:strand:+ start:1362 stop:2732 length:1371 start_codon:yes stop_codon:yes gene_type:complete